MIINTDYEVEKKLDIPYEKIITEIVEDVLDYENYPYEAGVNVVLTDNEEIRQMNLRARNIDAATDVLPLPMIDYEIASDFEHVEESAEDHFNLEIGELILGDITISVDKVEEQVEKYGHSMFRELAFLVTYSMLHLCGYDHMVGEERLETEQKWDEILERRGYR